MASLALIGEADVVHLPSCSLLSALERSGLCRVAVIHRARDIREISDRNDDHESHSA